MSATNKELHAAETITTIKAEHKDGQTGEVTVVTDKEEKSDLKFFKSHPLYISLKLSKTTPLRPYESAKIEISVMAPVGKSIPKKAWQDMDKTYGSLVTWCEGKMEEQVLAIENFKKTVNEKPGARV